MVLGLNGKSEAQARHGASNGLFSVVRFAANSPVEEAGFEPSVPRKAPGVRVALGSRSRRRMSVGRNSRRRHKPVSKSSYHAGTGSKSGFLSGKSGANSISGNLAMDAIPVKWGDE